MYIYKLGDRRLNLEFFVMCEPTIPPGRVRITMAEGHAFEVDGEDAVHFHETIDALRAENFPRTAGGVLRHDAESASAGSRPDVAPLAREVTA